MGLVRAAESEIKRTLELNPNLVGAHRTYAVYLGIHRRRELSANSIGQRTRPSFDYGQSGARHGAGNFRQNDQALEIQENSRTGSEQSGAQTVGLFYSRVGRYREAIAAYQEAVRLGNNGPDVQIILGCAYAKLGEREKAREIPSE